MALRGSTPDIGIGTSVIAGPTVPADAETVESEALKIPEFRSAVENGMRRFALNCTLAFVFFRFSFLHEFFSRHGLDLRILLVFGGLSTLTCLLAGTALSGFKYKSVSMWAAFLLCMCIATVTSSWRGGSVAVVLPYLRTTFLLVLLIPGVTYKIEDIKKLMSTIGVAGATSIVIGLLNSDFRSGRFELDNRHGTIQNANDYAAHMFLVMPAIAYWALRRGRNPFLKIIGVGLLLAGSYELLSTGSRGGLVAIIVTTLYVMKTGSARLKLGLIVGIPTLFALALPFVPGESAQRLRSLFISRDEDIGAAESREGRIALLKESISITFHHPLLGVGPGQFENFQGGEAAKKGERGMWHETHNAYTQISSECGIPALAFYLSAMVITFRSLRRSAKAGILTISPIANTLCIMLVGYSTSIFFLSQGYSFSLLVITGFSVSIERLCTASGQRPNV